MVEPSLVPAGVLIRHLQTPVFQYWPLPENLRLNLASSPDCSTEFRCKCIGVLSQTYQYWNSVLHVQSAELDSAAYFRAAASTGKQGFGDGRTAGRPHGSEAKVRGAETDTYIVTCIQGLGQGE